MTWCSFVSFFCSLQEVSFDGLRFSEAKPGCSNMPNNSCNALSNVTNQNHSYYSTVTSPPHGLGKRVLVARPGLVVVKNASNITIRTVTCSHKNTIAFYPSCPVLTNTHKRFVKFISKTPCHLSPLVRKVMEIRDIASVSLAVDHIKVERDSHDHAQSWTTLKPLVLATLMDFFSSDLPVYVDSPHHKHKSTDQCHLSHCIETNTMLEDLINTRIRPFVQEEDGDVVFKSFDRDNGSVHVQFYGTCLLNQKIVSALKEVLLTLLSFHVPEVTNVKQLGITAVERSQSSYF